MDRNRLNSNIGVSLPTGFGMWLFLLRDMVDLDGYIPFVELNTRARKLLDITTILAAKTRVLIWQLTKFRWFTHQHEKKYAKKYLKKYWEKIMALSRFDDGTTLLATWLWRIFRKIRAWHWDSTFPFHLVNIRECEKLSNANEFNHTMYN
ncbi:hypothetical protein SK128_025575, partial [Halocaridina rubra]